METRPLHFGGLAAYQEGAEGGEEHGHEGLFKWVNFLMLAGGLGYLLRKPVSVFFTERSAAIQKSLEEGRKALHAAQERLRAVEEKLQHLSEEIASFQAAAGKEMEAERERLRQAAAREAEKIMESARAQLEAATRAAKLELRIQAAEHAIQLAEETIRQRLDDSARGRLVSRFVQGLKGSSQSTARS